jgi:hypothetical protein
MIKKLFKLSACLLIVFMSAPVPVFGSALVHLAQQSNTATLRGMITDQHGAVVAGATVKVTHATTGTMRETQTSDEGIYILTNLQPGGYDVRVEAQGFDAKTTVVQLQVGQSATTDLTLGLSSLREEVVCLDCGIDMRPLIDSSTSKVDQVINEREIGNLPLNGRNFLELALLAPGNAPAPNFDPTKSNTVVISSVRSRRERHG